MKISVIIGAKNEEEFIGDCLESVKWADDIVFLLSPESVDKTEEIARSYNVRMVKQKVTEMNFAAWHNQGMEESKGEWLLWVDADERITPLLKEEILHAMGNTEFSAYAIPRRNFLLGKELKHGGWFPDYQIRLFKREKLKGWIGKLHEQAQFDGEIEKLKNAMIHLQPGTIEPALAKSIKWSGTEANLLFEAGHPAIVWWRVVRMGITTLFERLVKKQGFRDGTEGWIESIYQAFHTMIVYLKLWEMQRK